MFHNEIERALEIEGSVWNTGEKKGMKNKIGQRLFCLEQEISLSWSRNFKRGFSNFQESHFDLFATSKANGEN